MYEGRFYGTPYRIDGKVFMYNRLLFEEAGVDFVPETWEEFFVACEKLNKAGITPISSVTNNPGPFPTISELSIRSQFPKMYGSKTLILQRHLGSPGYVEALKKFTQLIPYFNQFPNAIKHAEARANSLLAICDDVCRDCGDSLYLYGRSRRIPGKLGNVCLP